METNYMNGDGNQDIIDNTFCETWRIEIVQNRHIFESESFSGVRHMGMYLNDDVLKVIYDIIQKYSTSIRLKGPE